MYAVLFTAILHAHAYRFLYSVHIQMVHEHMNLIAYKYFSDHA